MLKKNIDKIMLNLIPNKQWRHIIREALTEEKKEFSEKYIESNLSLFETNGIKITRTEDDLYYMEYQTLKIKSTSWDIAYIANEIICEGCYDFILPEGQKDIIMFDIGANVGTTSLYFTLKENIKKIYAFEAFEKTAQIAEENINLNDKNSKISLYKFGLGNKESTLDIPYDSHLIGSMSTIFPGRYCSTPLETTGRINIKQCSQVISPLLKSINRDNQKVFFKIDCEGAEFEILPDLEKNKLLNYIDIMIMEYHELQPDGLLQILQKNHFMAFIEKISDKLGIIKAVKIKSVGEQECAL